jgi:hypothetical protein
MRVVLALALAALAAPAVAQEEAACFTGEPKKVTFDNGRTTSIIQRHGNDITYTTPFAGGNDVVTKTHLLLFPKTSRMAARLIEYRWDSRLPRLDDLTPGFQYDVEGTMKSGEDPAQDYRIVGNVLAQDVVKIGKCDYPVLVIAAQSFVNGTPVVETTVSLSTEMMVVLKTEGKDLTSGKAYAYEAVTLE